MKRAVALLALVLAVLGAAPAAAEVVFADDFESGDLSAWDNVQSNRYAVTSDPAHVKTASYALESTIPEGPGWGEINKWFLPGYEASHRLLADALIQAIRRDV